ncbi:MAG TPA: SDR family oxidoreductase [Sinomonas sp.]|nr:SDR family oxidoreductase [Sinomonas sp.]
MPATASHHVALVTGASRGIGRAVAERLATDGYSLALGYGHDTGAAVEVAAAVEELGSRAVPVQADVTDPAAVAALFDAAEDAFGGIDVVVHAAARMSLSPLADFDLEELEGMLRTNVLGTFTVSQQAARRVRHGGAVVNFSSSVIGRLLPGYTGYAASKAAVEAMTFVLAHELRGRDITVNAIAPGPTATDMFLEGKTPDQVEFFANASPLERLGTPEDIANAVAFLVGPSGHWINGQTLRANGGLN